MRSVQRLGIVVATAAAGLALAGAPANAATTTPGPTGIIGATVCPTGYYGVIVHTSAAGDVMVCENIF